MKKLLAILLIFGFSAMAHAVGTCVVTDVSSTQIAAESNRISDPETVIVTVTCTADASAATFPAVTIPLLGFYPTNYLNTYNLYGYILYQVDRTPGSTAPTASYTTVITDNRGFPVDLALLTTNGSAAAAQMTLINSAAVGYPVIRGPLTVQISANLVNSAVITLDLVFRTRP